MFTLAICLHRYNPITSAISDAVQRYLQSELRNIDQIGRKRSRTLSHTFRNIRDISKLAENASVENGNSTIIRHNIREYFDGKSPIKSVIKETKKEMLEGGETGVLSREI